MTPDFDFKVRTSHFRGQGYRGLIALAIVALPRIVLCSAGGLVTYTWGRSLMGLAYAAFRP